MDLFVLRPTAFTWGFFSPAVVSAAGAGTRVELGIKYGPLVTKAHRRVADVLVCLTQGHVQGG